LPPAWIGLRDFLSTRRVARSFRRAGRSGFTAGETPAATRSFCFYNTKAEVDRFIEVVKEIQKFFGV